MAAGARVADWRELEFGDLHRLVVMNDKTFRRKTTLSCTSALWQAAVHAEIKAHIAADMRVEKLLNAAAEAWTRQPPPTAALTDAEWEAALSAEDAKTAAPEPTAADSDPAALGAYRCVMRHGCGHRWGEPDAVRLQCGICQPYGASVPLGEIRFDSFEGHLVAEMCVPKPRSFVCRPYRAWVNGAEVPRRKIDFGDGGDHWCIGVRIEAETTEERYKNRLTCVPDIAGVRVTMQYGDCVFRSAYTTALLADAGTP
jgi:hypothetical protein